MDRLIERLSDDLAGKTSRGRFLSGIAAVAAGAAALAAGLGLGTAVADTYCCAPIPCPPPPPGGMQKCPDTTYEDDSSTYCCRSVNLYECIPCRNDSNNQINCYLWIEVQGNTCPTRRT